MNSWQCTHDWGALTRAEIASARDAGALAVLAVGSGAARPRSAGRRPRANAFVASSTLAAAGDGRAMGLGAYGFLRLACRPVPGDSRGHCKANVAAHAGTRQGWQALRPATRVRRVPG